MVQSRDKGSPRPGCLGLHELSGLVPPAPGPGQGPALTGEDLEGERVLLLDGVGKVKAGIAAVVCLHVLQHHVREIQVPVMALGHPLVLGDGLHGYKEAEVQKEVSSNGDSNTIVIVLATEHRQGAPWARNPTRLGLVLSTLRQGLFAFHT